MDTSLASGKSDKPIFINLKAKSKKKAKPKHKKSEFQQVKKKTNRQKLGAIIEDAMFLEQLSRNVDFGKQVFDPVTGKYGEDKFGKIIKNHAQEAVTYFAKKTDFWEECSKMAPTAKKHHGNREHDEGDEGTDWGTVVSGATTETFDRYTPWQLSQQWALVQVQLSAELIIIS